MADVSAGSNLPRQGCFTTVNLICELKWVCAKNQPYFLSLTGTAVGQVRQGTVMTLASAFLFLCISPACWFRLFQFRGDVRRVLPF